MEITIELIFMEFGADIQSLQRMKPKNVGDSKTFHLAPPAGTFFHLFSEISQHLLSELAHNFV